MHVGLSAPPSESVFRSHGELGRCEKDVEKVACCSKPFLCGGIYRFDVVKTNRGGAYSSRMPALHRDLFLGLPILINRRSRGSAIQ